MLTITSLLLNFQNILNQQKILFFHIVWFIVNKGSNKSNKDKSPQKKMIEINQCHKIFRYVNILLCSMCIETRYVHDAFVPPLYHVECRQQAQLCGFSLFRKDISVYYLPKMKPSIYTNTHIRYLVFGIFKTK